MKFIRKRFIIYFCHVGIVQTKATVKESDSEDDLTLAELIRINKLIPLNDCKDFVNVYNTVIVKAELPDIELVNQTLQEDNTAEETEVTTEVTLSCAQTLQPYFIQQENSTEE